MDQDEPVRVEWLQWVRLRKYCELTGDTRAAVHARRRPRTGRNGETIPPRWINGVHCCIGPDGNLWINLLAVNRWVEGRDVQPG